MCEQTKVISSNNHLLDQKIAVIIDTNILIEFKEVSQIPWSRLFPNATAITVLVPQTVLKEMDGHKKATARLRRRALDFNKIIVSIEDGNGKSVILREDIPEVKIELMPRYAQSELTDEKLSLDSNDDRIVAEALRYARDLPKVLFLVDDNNARRTAREMGLRVARPAEVWRRQEPKDERDAEIEALKRQLGAAPRIVFLGIGSDEPVLFETLRAEAIPEDFCDCVADLLISKNQGRSREELIKKYNPLPANGVLGLINPPFSVSIDDIDNYCEKYRKFEAKVQEWADRLPDIISRLKFAAPFSVKIENTGEAFAEDIKIVLSTSQGFGFLSEYTTQLHLNFGHEPPEVKSSMTPQYSGPTSFDLQRQHEVDPFTFYPKQTPSFNEASSQISFECQKFRHGNSKILSGVIGMCDGAPSGGCISVQATSASLADPVRSAVPIKVVQEVSDDFKSYIGARLLFFPENVRGVIEDALAEF